MQNDDYGKDYYDGMRDGLGKDVGKIVKHVTYGDRPDGRFARLSSRTRAPTYSSTSRRRNLRGLSTRQPTSAGSRSIT